MNHFKRIILLFATVAPSILGAQMETSSAPEQPLTIEERIAAFDGLLIARPRSHAGTFDTKIVTFRIDGIDGRHFAMVGDLVSLKTSVPNNWQESPQHSNRFSIAFSHRYEPQLLMTFTAFKDESFSLADDSDSFIAYLAGLRAINKDKFVINHIPDDFREPGFNRYLLGGNTYHFDYSIVDPEDGDRTQNFLVYFVKIDEGWLEITLQGPPEQVNWSTSEFKRFLRNFSIVQNEEEAFGL